MSYYDAFNCFRAERVGLNEKRFKMFFFARVFMSLFWNIFELF